MFSLTALELARIQFGFTITFHIIFPAITFGLAAFLAVLEGLWLWKKDSTYLHLYHFWSKIFAVNFAMGVVSGLLMAYPFGTHWGFYSQFAGSITGPLLTYAVLTAFVLEAGFLGVMLFGWHRVGRGLHFFATVMVAVGTMISATWILASNSWMQTPQGHEVINGGVVPMDWFVIIFNPSFPYRLAHMVTAAMLSTALFVGASAAWHLLRGNRTPAVRRMFSMALWMLLFTAPLQVLIGDMYGLDTLKYQPAKIAAVEGHWNNTPGMLMLVLGLYGAWLRWRGRLYESRGLARFALWMGPSGLVALLAGWYVTEIGRQPWVLYGLMRTQHALSDHSALTLSVGLVVLVVMYLGVFGTGVAYLLRLVRKGPQVYDDDQPVAANQRLARPLSAVDDPLYPHSPNYTG